MSGKNHRRQTQHGRFLRTAPSTIADLALAADHDHAPSVDHPSDALDQRSAQWVISDKQPRVISDKRRRQLQKLAGEHRCVAG